MTAPLERAPIDCPPECSAFAWRITDLDELARQVALIFLAEHDHVLRLSRANEHLDPVAVPQDTIIESILSGPLRALQLNEKPWQRDGLLFQHIMWIATTCSSAETDLFSCPHTRNADKGQDMLVVHLRDGIVDGVRICEHKATIDPRDTLTSKVWREIKHYETHVRDYELQSETVSILAEEFGRQRAKEIAESLFWKERKSYRVSVTTERNPGNEDESKALFDGFENAAPGAHDRRMGDTVEIATLRTWMDAFAVRVRDQLDSMRAAPEAENV